ncbi:MAG: hypothetical protein M9888_05005 [Chitinophagales bacterium]|nr:hypothetical protein [Chitinophagales bacterium]
MKYIKHLFVLLVLTSSVSCKKDPVAQKPESEYQETRNARITGIELTDKDFRQYFIYGEDGLLDSVKREGDIWYSDPLENTITVSHGTDYIRLHTNYDNRDDGLWRDVKIFHTNKKIVGTEYALRLIPIYPPMLYGNQISYYPNSNIQNAFYYITRESFMLPYIYDIQYDVHKIEQYKGSGEYYFMLPIIQVSGINTLDFYFSYIYAPQPLISPDVKRFINNGFVNFVRLGENHFVEWENLVYGLSGYELPMKEENEIISEIRIRGYSKEDNSLLLDSTVTFDYQVDTLNRKISFGNQVVSYEFID